MKQLQKNTKYLLITCILLFGGLVVNGCSPSINSFNVEPKTIVKNKPVFVSWDVSRGTPILKVQESTKTEKVGDSLIHYIDYTLVIKENENEKRTQTVTVLPNVFLNAIEFPTDFFGDKIIDTLVAQGTKNKELWGDSFEILSISSSDTTGRELFVTHGGASALLDPTGIPSEIFKGTPIEGKWEIKYVMNESEINNPTLRPESFKLIALVQYKERKK